ncbi:BrnT family toxin [Candidatus Nitrospira nitrificans]|uniref:BrnT family toxin n=1 Tax=Candidatus Nitrospira nitrificans TaxID=1742973 RepID=UPI000B89FC1C
MGLLFEWDERKAKQNLAKHSISFEEASTISATHCRLRSTIFPIRWGEQRCVTVGHSSKHRLLIVVHTDRSGRIISARPATRRERNL